MTATKRITARGVNNRRGLMVIYDLKSAAAT
jgi:hypothetical protein